MAKSKAYSVLQGLLIAVLAALPLLASGQYPSKPIHVVVPYLAGGSADILARLIGPKLATAWGQPVVVDNRPGAGGNVGADIVAKAAPDGYTLMFTPPAPLSINPFLYKDMPFDPRTAFAPVSVLAVMPNILIVGPRVSARNLSEFIAYAKANPGKLSYGSQGVGTTPHLTGAMLALATGINIVHVPYKGFPPLLTDMLGSRLDFAFADASNVLPRLKEGKVRALAVASATRFFGLPDTPTMIEAGVPDFLSTTWMSYAAPAGTPPAITRKWHEQLAQIVKAADIRERFAVLGVEAWASSPDEMQRQIDSELKRWGDVIQRTGARAN